MFKTLLLSLVALSAAQPVSAQPPVPPLQPVRIILVGDSTMAVKSGYGPGFCALVVEPGTCVNMAKGGRSSGSYRAEGSWTQVMDQLKTNSAFSETYVLIQFGHNDQPGKPGRSTDLATEFPSNLARYLEDVQSTGAKPVLVTALTRRSFRDGKLKDDLEPWAAATRKMGADANIPVLDLHAESSAAVQKMGPSNANTLAMGPPPPVAVESAANGNSAPVPKANGPEFDYTHLGAKGAAYFGRMVADELVQALPELAPYFKR
jgi:lysophospholipase L1-like esterase